MIKKQTVKNLFVGFFAALVIVSIGLANGTVFAAQENGCEVDTAIIKCDNVNVDEDGVENTGAWSLLLTAINILTAGIGVVALGGIIYGAILYISAGGSADQIKKAVGIFTNIVIGVIAYALMYSVLNFLVPGGLFN